MWDAAEETWGQDGIVEYGIHQIDTSIDCPIWRRHSGGRQTRFRSVRSGLFGKQGARKACLGEAPYPKGRYAAEGQLFVPYAATWLQDFEYAYLVRPSAGAPEVTLVSTSAIEAISAFSDQQILSELASLFGIGAEENGVRRLRSNSIVAP